VMCPRRLNRVAPGGRLVEAPRESLIADVPLTSSYVGAAPRVRRFV